MPQTRQLAAIMFADIAGYTSLMESDEALAKETMIWYDQYPGPVN